MAEKKQKSSEYDSPWKEALEIYFRPFMAFFFPAIHDEIDWDREHAFLDKELEKIVRDAEIGKRRVDKLVKVFLLEGGEAWLLIHIEVQGYYDSDFPERMFVYNYRIFDRYHAEVVSLAVLTDNVPGFRPSEYRRGRSGCYHVFQFPVMKILDFASEWEKLEGDENPFSLVVMAHLKAISVNDGQERKHWKLHLMRLLIDRNYGRKDIYELFRFIDWLLVLPKDLEISFSEELSQIMEEKKMPYITSVERVAEKKGYDRGVEKGMEKGKHQGMREGLIEAIELGLSLRFGEDGLRMMSRIRRIRKLDRLRAIKELVRDTTDLKDFTGKI